MGVSASRLIADSVRVLPRKHLSRLMGRLADLEVPQSLLGPAVDAFARVCGVDLTECEVPAEGFASFDEFFVRRLRHGSRPVDADEDTWVSPADGRLQAAGMLDRDAALVVKGRRYSVGQLLDDEAEAARFADGFYAVVYLAPPDYHRVHAPVTGKVRGLRHVDGTLLPVNGIGLRYFPELFVQNERVAVYQESPRHGNTATVLVGAIGVGRITLAFADLVTNRASQSGGEVVRYAEGEAPHLARGDELGAFHLGSTVVLLMAKGDGLRWLKQPGQRVQVGEALARRGAGP